jgi:Ricin-type beta-trefoil lectin domain
MQKKETTPGNALDPTPARRRRRYRGDPTVKITLTRIALAVVATLALFIADGAGQPSAVMASAGSAGTQVDGTGAGASKTSSKLVAVPLAGPGSGYYELGMIDESGSLWCLDADISGGGLHNGAKVQLWECRDTANQVWHFTGGTLVNQFNTAYCLDVNLTSPAAQDADGHRLLVRPCAGQSNQRWSWNDDLSLQSHWNGKCADANVSTIGKGDPIALWGCISGKDNQTWYDILPVPRRLAVA